MDRDLGNLPLSQLYRMHDGRLGTELEACIEARDALLNKRDELDVKIRKIRERIARIEQAATEV